MTTYPTRLIDRSECGEDAVTFRFERPADYRFVAGQYAVLHVEGPEGPVGKPFTWFMFIRSANTTTHPRLNTRVRTSSISKEPAEPTRRPAATCGLERIKPSGRK